MLRALSKTPAVVETFFAEVGQARGAHAALDRMALALQASLLVRNAPAFASDAFCHSLLEQQGHHNYGTLPRGVDVAAIIARATPQIA